MFGRGQLEVEVAVARGKEFLARVVFRPPHGFSIGSSNEATITIPDSPLRGLTEILTFDDGRPTLLFTDDSRLEVDADGARLSVAELLGSGMAEAGAEQHTLPLAEGVRAVFLFGSLKLLIKVRAALDVSVWNLPLGDVGTCGGCGSKILWLPTTTSGALIPCSECGDLNRFEPESEVETEVEVEVEPESESELQEPLSLTGGAASLPSTDGLDLIAAQEQVPSPPQSASRGPDSSAYDDDEEATELASIEPQPSPEVETASSPIIESFGGVDEDEDDAPTDPGRGIPVIEGPTSLPTHAGSFASDSAPVSMLSPTVGGPGFEASVEASPAAEEPPERDLAPAGWDAGAPRRRRPLPKPNYLGWTLVFVGMMSGLGGLVLLLLAALRLGSLT
jgi:hypothetical protein